MKNSFLVYCFLLFLPVLSKGQNSLQPNGVGLKLVTTDYFFSGKFNPYSGNTSIGLEVSYLRHLSNNFNLAVPLRIGQVNVPQPDLTSYASCYLTSLDAVIQLHFLPKNDPITPYVYAGLGVAMYTFSGGNLQLPAGIGVNFQIMPQLYVNSQFEMRFSSTENRNNLQVGLGIIYLFRNRILPGEKSGAPPSSRSALHPLLVDTDGDGLADDEDLCPDLPGTRKNSGCPDTDGDGVVDRLDDCPNEKGEKRFNGCPDTDKDGVMDRKDNCPTIPGPVANKGCPLNALTAQEMNFLDTAKFLIKFETGTDEILQPSLEILDRIAKILKNYTNASLDIAAHTDSIGDEASNQTLSEKRAKACYDYLIANGIKPERLTYTGFGEKKPIDTNMYESGRSRNRRIEFTIKQK